MQESSQGKTVLVLVERENEGVASITLELLNLGRVLAQKLEGSLSAVLVGYGVANLANDVARFADQVYCLDNSLFRVFQVEAYTAALESLCKKISPYIILVGHTLDNVDLAPRLAYRVGARLVTDCIQVDLDTQNNALLCSKPVYGGNVIATFSIASRPWMVTLRPKIMEPAQSSPVAGKVTNIEVALDGSLVRTELVETVPLDSVSLDKADAIVAGGRGIGGIEGIEELKKLAQSLRKYFNMVEIGASRPVTDAGWLPTSRQVGLTGERVSPQVYFAVGISGASQHISGITGAKKIVAINKDLRAPIFRYADYGVVGDYRSVVPALTKKLGELS